MEALGDFIAPDRGCFAICPCVAVTMVQNGLGRFGEGMERTGFFVVVDFAFPAPNTTTKQPSASLMDIALWKGNELGTKMTEK